MPELLNIARNINGSYPEPIRLRAVAAVSQIGAGAGELQNIRDNINGNYPDSIRNAAREALKKMEGRK